MQLPEALHQGRLLRFNKAFPFLHQSALVQATLLLHLPNQEILLVWILPPPPQSILPQLPLQPIQLQQLLLLADYGQKLPVEEQRVMLPAIADVQARSLEAIEKMVWQEIMLVQFGELTWFDQKMIKEIETGRRWGLLHNLQFLF